MIGLKILLFVVRELVLLAQTDQQNGQTSHKGEQNDKSYQKVKISRKVYQKGQKSYPTSYKKVNKIFQFQKGSAHQHGTAFGIVDGNCSYWCYGEQKKIRAIAFAPKFQRNGSDDASGSMDVFFQPGMKLRGSCGHKIIIIVDCSSMENFCQLCWTPSHARADAPNSAHHH